MKKKSIMVVLCSRLSSVLFFLILECGDGNVNGLMNSIPNKDSLLSLLSYRRRELGKVGWGLCLIFLMTEDLTHVYLTKDFPPVPCLWTELHWS